MNCHQLKVMLLSQSQPASNGIHSLSPVIPIKTTLKSHSAFELSVGLAKALL